ncbi:hypothetical protein GCM10011315_36800 [Roseovarius pacificus]|nr:hypothetical protein GCM10011315_36800 [Roseovarius pacificus]
MRICAVNILRKVSKSELMAGLSAAPAAWVAVWDAEAVWVVVGDMDVILSLFRV